MTKPSPATEEIEVLQARIRTLSDQIASARDQMADCVQTMRTELSHARAALAHGGDPDPHLAELDRLAERARTTLTALGPSAAAGPRTPAPSPRPTQLQSCVLVVEDEPMVAELTRRILAQAGHHVVVRGDGQAAIDTIRAGEHPIHVVVSDIVMPRLSGLELTKVLAHEFPDLPVLLVSGYPEDEHRQGDDTLAVTPFLAKPFKATDLTGAVAALLGRSPIAAVNGVANAQNVSQSSSRPL